MSYGKIRVEMKDGSVFKTKVTCNGIVLPCTEVRINPISVHNYRGYHTADITVLIDELDLDGIEAVATLAWRPPVLG